MQMVEYTDYPESAYFYMKNQKHTKEVYIEKS